MLGNPPMPPFGMEIGEEPHEVENYEVNNRVTTQTSFGLLLHRSSFVCLFVC